MGGISAASGTRHNNEGGYVQIDEETLQRWISWKVFPKRNRRDTCLVFGGKRAVAARGVVPVDDSR